MTAVGNNALNTRTTLTAAGKTYAYYSLSKAAAQLGDVSRPPFSVKVLLANLLRFEDGTTVTGGWASLTFSAAAWLRCRLWAA